MAANRVMTGISSWIERKLFLKVNATKSKVVRPLWDFTWFNWNA